jgi:NADH dehydrogenase
VVVVGGGLAGVEVACELAATHIVHLVEARDLSHLGGAQAHVEVVLADLGVTVHTGRGVARIDPGAVVLDDGSVLEAATAVVTTGLRASPLAGQLSERLDPLGRVPVGPTLRVEPHDAVFVAGDVAAVEIRPGRPAPMSCQCAIPMGTTAGRNAVRALAGLEPEPYVQERYVTCFDLGAAGAVLTVGFERAIHLDGAAAKDVKRRINRELILPPPAGDVAVR